MSSSETEAQTLASLAGSRDIPRVLRLVSELCKTLSSQLADGKARLVHPSQVALTTSPAGQDGLGEIKAITLAGTDAASDPAVDLAAAYVAPEVFAGKPVAVASTVYHVAALTYHLLTGQAPFSASSPAAIRIKVLLEKPENPHSVRPELSVELAQVLMCALDKKPEARPQTLEDLVAQLAKAEQSAAPARSAASASVPAAPGSGQASIAPRTQHAQAPQSTKRKSAVAAFIVAVVVLLVSASLLVLHGADEPASAPSAAMENKAADPSAARSGAPAAAAPAPGAPAPAPAPPPPPPMAQGEAAPIGAAREAKKTRPDDLDEEAAPPKPKKKSKVGAVTRAAAPSPSSKAPRSLGRMEPDLDDSSAPGAAAPAEASKTPRTAMRGGKGSTAPSSAKPALKSMAQGIKPLAGKSKGKKQKSKADSDFADTDSIRLAKPVVRPAAPPMATGELPASEQQQRQPDAFGDPASAVQANPHRAESQPGTASAPRTSKKKVFVGIALLVIAMIAAVGASLLLWVIRRDRLVALQSANTQRAGSEADTVPTTKTEEPKSSRGAIDPFTVGQYTCFERLGEGGMGMVYKARHTLTGREAAVKVLSPSAMVAPDAIELFQREAKLSSQINHPNSVFIYDHGNVSDALFYLVMEFIDGKSLDEIISPKGKAPRPLPIARVLTLTRQICSVLDTAHAQGIVHRGL